MRLIDIIKKDVLVVLRDGKALIFILLMPIVLMSILGLALGGIFSSGTFSIGQINIAVVDESTAPDMTGMHPGMQTIDFEAMSLYNVLDADEIKSFISYEKMDKDAAEQQLQNNEIDAIVSIPQNFNAQLIQAIMPINFDETVSNVNAEILVKGRSGKTLETNIVSSVVSAYTNTVSSISADVTILLKNIIQQRAWEQIPNIDMQSFAKELTDTSIKSALDIQEKGVAKRNPINSFAYYSIAITCMFVLYSAGQGSVFLHTENKEKTLSRLWAAGISRRKLLLGKAAAVLCLCLVQLILLFTFSTLAFGLKWGSILVFIITSLCVAVSVTGLGVLLMVLVYRAGNPRIGNVFQSILVQVFALFGGSFLPLSALPKFFSTISLFTPNGLAIHAYTANMTGAPFGEVLPYLLGSIGIGIVLFILGTALFPRERRA